MCVFQLYSKQNQRHSPELNTGLRLVEVLRLLRAFQPTSLSPKRIIQISILSSTFSFFILYLCQNHSSQLCRIFPWSNKHCISNYNKYMDRYEILKDIGSGNFAVAKLVRDIFTKELFAVKFIERGHKVWFFKLVWSIFLFWAFMLILHVGIDCFLFLWKYMYCRLMIMSRGKSWTIDHWSIPISLDSKRLVKSWF